MAEYIERQALLAEYDRVHVGPPGGARKLIEEAPAADVVPVVHGRWVWHLGEWVSCSECHTIGSPQWKGCPVCLARMDGGDGNG